MTEVNIYHSIAQPDLLLCRLVAKCYHQRLPTVVLARDANHAATLDALLWREPAESFIPHSRWQEGVIQEGATGVDEVLIVEQVPLLPDYGVLINLQEEVPVAFARFLRLIELVSLDEEDRQKSRVRYKHYAHCGYAITAHDMMGKL